MIEHVARENAKDTIAAIPKIALPDGVALRTVAEIMGASIHLNDHAGRPDEEVNDIGANRMLSSDLETHLAAAKMTPQ
jgi:hypothetical protein